MHTAGMPLGITLPLSGLKVNIWTQVEIAKTFPDILVTVFK
jgi:hypothetical protein